MCIINKVKKSETKFFSYDEDFNFLSGDVLSGFELAYESYGELNKDKSNAILLFHALSASHHASGFNIDFENEFWGDDMAVGWWDSFIGSGKALNTDKFFIICVNYLGGCYGSSGPNSINPKTGRRYGSEFPNIRAIDVVNSQVKLLDSLGINKLHAVIGASVGGLMALTFVANYPEMVDIVIPISCGHKASDLQRLTILEQIYAIENDKNFNRGSYYDGEKPLQGLALARMISHKTFISIKTIAKRARKDIHNYPDVFSWYKVSDVLESYILHQGLSFTKRFDANTYLRILELWQKFDLLAESGKSDYSEIFNVKYGHKYLVFSIDSDVCFYPEEQGRTVFLLKECGLNPMHITVHSEKGHDSFLLEPNLFTPHIKFILG